MRRIVLLVITLAFILGLSFLTFRDVVDNHGVTVLDVVSFLIVAFMTVALVGALGAPHPPPED